MDTLVREPFYREMPEFFGLSFEELMAAKHPSAWIDFELGQLDEREFLTRFFRDGRAFDHAGFLAAVERGYRWLPGMEELVTALRARGHELHALSNYPEWFTRIEARLGLSRYLAWSFVSCRTGVRKPDVLAFTGAAAQLGVAPAACLFVDDRQENCAAARAVGMSALDFTGSERLWIELAQRGLLAAR